MKEDGIKREKRGRKRPRREDLIGDGFLPWERLWITPGRISGQDRTGPGAEEITTKWPDGREGVAPYRC